jgi:hypothetical protein|tara:strand:+ start:2229 stop:2690 length:462 start_codon:yes stop_codon:yes gene_type:complete
MATTVTAEDLTVTIIEQYTLNGVSYGNTMNKTFTSNGEVYQRVMTIAAQSRGSAWTNIINFGAADAAGIADITNYKYFRIKNLDDTNFLELRVTGTADSFFVKIKAGETFLLMDNEIDAVASGTTIGTLTDITQIGANANTDAIDIEFVVVTA